VRIQTDNLLTPASAAKLAGVSRQAMYQRLSRAGSDIKTLAIDGVLFVRADCKGMERLAKATDDTKQKANS